MKGSSLEVFSSTELTRRNVTFMGMGVNGLVTIGQTGNVDMKVPDDCYLNGGQLNVKAGNFGDGADMQVVDKDLVYQNALVPGTPYTYAQAIPSYPLLAQFATNIQIIDSQQKQMEFDLPYLAKILAGMYLRIVYRSTGTLAGNVLVAGNFMLHKCMV